MKELKIKDIEDTRVLFAIRKICKTIIYLSDHVSADEEFNYKLSRARSLFKPDIDELANISFGRQVVNNDDGSKTISEYRMYPGNLTLETLLLIFSDFYNLAKDSFTDFEEENDFIVYYEFLEKFKEQDAVDINYFWNYIHKDLKDKFSWEFLNNKKNAVFDLTVFLEEKIRNKVKKEVGEDLSGVYLMRRAFAPNSPVIKVVPTLDNQINKDIQEGTMNLAVSIMQKIKNPKSHSLEHNEDDEVFIGYIFLCDSLYRKIKSLI